MIDHLWQSSLFVGAAGLLTLALRENPAQVRYWVWFAASVKFLIPFSLLIGLGSLVPRPVTAPPIQAQWVAMVEQLGEPPITLPRVPVPADRAHHDYAPIVAVVVWACGFAAIAICWLVRRKRVYALRGSAAPLELDFAVPVLSAPGLVEPGIVGIFRPVLLLPEGIEERLDRAQLDAILTHELCHVRRRDNLTATIHMSVQAIFWFHPLVWWIGVRLVDERERACDEEVLRVFGPPKIYAEGILNVCKLYVESRLACVSGVTGSNLKRRIEAIMKNRIGLKLNFAKKAVLAVAGIAAVATPIAIGVLNASSARAQSILAGPPGRPRPSFELASVKPIDRATMHRDHEGKQLDRAVFVDRTDLFTYIVRAYVRGGSCDIKAALGQDCPLISGSLPVWAKQDRFEIQAKLRINSLPNYTSRQLRNNDTPELNLMLQVLLEDRFHLKVHRETKEIPVYVLTVGKNGPRLKQTAGALVVKAGDGTSTEFHGLTGSLRVPTQDGTPRGRIGFQASTLQEAASSLGWYLDRPILDRTGLTGEYDFTLEYEVDPSPPEPPTVDKTSGLGGNVVNMFSGLTSSALSLALQDVGLRLESTKAPVEVLVIDHLERPSEN